MGQGLSRQKLQKTRKDAKKVFRSRTTINFQNKLLSSKFLEGTKLTLMLIQAEFYYLIDTQPTVHPKCIHKGTIHTMLQEWKVFPLWEIILSWREKMIFPLPVTITCSFPALKRAMKAFPWLLETISKAKRRWGWGRNGIGREGMITPVYLSLKLLIVLVICLFLVLVSVGQNTYQHTLPLFIWCLQHLYQNVNQHQQCVSLCWW